MREARVLYAKHQQTVFLKFTGDIRYTAPALHKFSSMMDAFLAKLFAERDFDRVFVDLSEAASIDSTNLGLLVKLALFTEREFGNVPVIYSTNPWVTEILHQTGLNLVFEIIEAPLPPLSHAPLPESAEGNITEARRVVLEAHQALMELNEQNRAAFREVVETLELGSGMQD